MSLESRVELILQNILGASNEVDPESRVEKLLQNLIEVAYEVDPMSRVELLLENLQGGENEVIPQSRVEMLIANALGASYDVVPQSRVEELLVLLAEQYATEYKTLTGAIVTLNDAVANEPFKQLVVDISPVQDLSSGDPSPTNICPISGWTGMTVNATNTNLCGGSKLLANAQNYIPGGTTNTEEEYFQFSSGASTDNDYRFSSGVPFNENTQYTFIFTLYKTSGTGTNIRVNYTDGSYSAIPTVSSAGVKETVVYTSSNGKTIANVSKTNNSGNTRIYYNESGVFEGVLTADDFEPYKGRIINVNWQTEAGTVYGGKLDVLSGVMTVTHSYMQLVLTGWALSGSNFWHSLTTMSNTRPAQVGWCTHYKNEVTATGNNTIIFGYSSFSASPRIIIRDSRFTTASDFMAFLDAQGTNGTPVMIEYPLATPTTYQLTPTEVNSLLGQNNIWADTGNTTVEYLAYTHGGGEG